LMISLAHFDEELSDTILSIPGAETSTVRVTIATTNPMY
jgi:hypothetical protein